MNKAVHSFCLFLLGMLICLTPGVPVVTIPEVHPYTQQSLISGSEDKPQMESISGPSTVNLVAAKSIHQFSPAKADDLHTCQISVQAKRCGQTQTFFAIKKYLSFIYPTHNFW